MANEEKKNMFWGLFFIVLGVLLLFNYILGIDLPIFKILFSCFIIYLGASMLFGTFNMEVPRGKKATDNEAVFAKATFKFPSVGSAGEEKNNYTTAFGSSTLDLTDTDPSRNPQINVTVAFGETKIRIKKGTPLRVKSTTAFGHSALPDKNTNALGEVSYKSEGLKDGDNAINVNATVAFGHLKIEEI